MEALRQLEQVYSEAKNDPDFWSELGHYLSTYAGRPSPLYFARRLTEQLGGARIYLKREDLNHTGAHKSTTRSAKCCLPSGWASRG